MIEPTKVYDSPLDLPRGGRLARALRALLVERRVPYVVGRVIDRWLKRMGIPLKKLRVGGATMFIRRGSWDEGVVRLMLERQDYTRDGFDFPEDATVVDIGGNIGGFAILVARKASRGRVIVAEPASDNWSLLLRNVGANNLRNVEVSRVAVAGRSGVLRLYKESEGALHTIVEEARRGGDSYEEVPAVSLEELFRQFNVERCHFLKLDCEGAEFEILYAAGSVLSRVDKIALEYHAAADKIGRSQELLRFLVRHGFEVFEYSDFVGHNCGFLRVQRPTGDVRG